MNISKYEDQLDLSFSFLHKVIKMEDIDITTFGISMTLFHYYTYLKTLKSFDKFKLLISCIFLAVKIKGSFIHLEKLKAIYKKHKTLDLTDKEIVGYELELMNFLGFELEIETPFMYLDRVFKSKQIHIIFDKIIKIHSNNSNKEFLNKVSIDNNHENSFKNLCYNLVFDCYRRAFCIVFRPEIIALSVLSLTYCITISNKDIINNSSIIELNQEITVSETKFIYSLFFKNEEAYEDFNLCLNEIVSFFCKKFALS